MFTNKQIAALKYIIAHSSDCCDQTKQLLWFLIENSKKLTEPVSLSLVQDREGFSREEIKKIAKGFHDVCSSSCSTFLDQILHCMGSKLLFSVHYGHYVMGNFDTTGQFTGAQTMSYTFWLAEKTYGHSGSGKLLEMSRSDIEIINLKKPGLYPLTENQENYS